MKIDKNFVEKMIEEDKQSKETKDEKIIREQKEMHKQEVTDASKLFTWFIIFIMIVALFLMLSMFRSCSKNNTKSEIPYSEVTQEDECAILVRKWKDCINRSYLGETCLPGTDIILPDRCNNPTYLKR